MTERAIPMFTCAEIQPVVDFYVALGFAVTFLQKAPYGYLVVERGDVELQFYRMKGFDPATSLGGCYVLTDDVDSLYEAFRTGLKASYGRVPARGIPRMGPLKNTTYGVRQFVMTDPAGNSIRVGQPTGESLEHQPVPTETFARALHMANLFADSKEDLPAAVKIIDRVLVLPERQPTPVQAVQLLVLRADLAQRLGEREQAIELLARAKATQLSDEERESVRDALRRADELAEGPLGTAVKRCASR